MAEIFANLTHAGGVVSRPQSDGPECLLVRASRAPFAWVLPKGHIEPGETPEETAHREVLEETGVDAGIVCQLGDVPFELDGKKIVVRYFAMRFRRSGIAAESRETLWCSMAEAERLLKFEGTRNIVRHAAGRTR